MILSFSLWVYLLKNRLHGYKRNNSIDTAGYTVTVTVTPVTVSVFGYRTCPKTTRPGTWPGLEGVASLLRWNRFSLPAMFSVSFALAFAVTPELLPMASLHGLGWWLVTIAHDAAWLYGSRHAIKHMALKNRQHRTDKKNALHTPPRAIQPKKNPTANTAAMDSTR